MQLAEPIIESDQVGKIKLYGEGAARAKARDLIRQAVERSALSSGTANAVGSATRLGHSERVGDVAASHHERDRSRDDRGTTWVAQSSYNRGRDGRRDYGGKDDHGRDDRGRDDRGRDDHRWDDRGRDYRGRDDRGRDEHRWGDRGRDARDKDGRSKDDRSKEDRSKDDRSKDDRGRDDHGRDNHGRDNRGNGDRSRDDRGSGHRGRDLPHRDDRNWDDRGKDRVGIGDSRHEHDGRREIGERDKDKGAYHADPSHLGEPCRYGRRPGDRTPAEPGERVDPPRRIDVPARTEVVRYTEMGMQSARASTSLRPDLLDASLTEHVPDQLRRQTVGTIEPTETSSISPSVDPRRFSLSGLAPAISPKSEDGKNTVELWNQTKKDDVQRWLSTSNYGAELSEPSPPAAPGQQEAVKTIELGELSHTMSRTRTDTNGLVRKRARLT